MDNKEQHMHILNTVNRISAYKISFKDEHFKLKSLLLWKLNKVWIRIFCTIL